MNSPACATVFIVDDDEAVRESLIILLQSEGLAAQAFGSAEAFLAAAPSAAAGCIIADIHMTGMTGLELQQELRRRHIDLPCIIITGQSDVPKAVAALKGGAVDYLEKPYRVDSLLQAVGEAIGRLRQQRRHSVSLDEIAARRGRLSQREQEVMELMIAGHPNKVIATRLGISARTVENHRAKVMDKMQCANLPALIHLSLRLML
jgi:FixJ family two-component response regulator